MMHVKLFAVLALAAIAHAELQEETLSELGLTTSDDQEKAQLSGKLLAFEDFCLHSRDWVSSEIKKTANDLSARVFSFFFDSGEIIFSEALDVAKDGKTKLSGQLADPEAPIAEPSNEVERTIAGGQERIKQVGQPRAILEAFKAGVGAISKAVQNRVSEGIENLKQFATTDKLVEALQEGCSRVAVFEKELTQQFEEYKASLGEKSPELGGLEFNNIPCATTKKVRRAEGVCSFVKSVRDPLQKLYQTRSKKAEN